MAAFLTVLLVVSAVGPAMAAATIDDPNQINYEATASHNPEIPVDVTKDVHVVGEWGVTEYESDSGDVVALDASLNDSVANPVTLTATDVNVSEFGAFPRTGDSHGNASALDASEWVTEGANASKLTVTDTTTAPNVEAVRIDTDGSLGADDVAAANYSHVKIDSDEDKRYLQLAADVDELDTGAHVEVRVLDEDGDYKAVVIDPDNSTNASNVLANGTGEGYVLQQQLGELTTTTVSGSDGTFDNVRELKVNVTDGDFDGSFALINAEKMGRYLFGKQAYDGADDDSDKDDTRQLYEPTGAYSITSFSSMGAAFDGAEVHDATLPMTFQASNLEKKMDAHVEFTEDSGEGQVFPSFEWIVDVYYRLELPAAYDLSYANAKLTDTVELPGSRYQSVEIAEGVGDTEFSEISSWTDKTSSYDARGANVTLDSTIQPGQQIAIHYEYPVSADAKSAMANTGGGPGQFERQSGGGFVGWLKSLPVIGSIISLVGMLLGGKWVMGK